MRDVLAACAIVLILGASQARSQSFDPSQPLSRDQIAFAEHLARHYSAYFLKLNENLGPGDTILLPRFQRDAPREFCFPGTSAPDKDPQGLYEAGKRRNDLAGKLAVEAGIDASIDVTFVEEVDNGLKDIRASHIPYDFRNLYDAAACPWVERFYGQGLHDGKHILVRSVIFAEGTYSVNYKLRVEGSISADVAGKIRSYLKKWRLSSILPDEKIEAALSGSFQRSDPATSAWNQLIPVGFIPESVNEERMRQFVEAFLYKKREHELWDAIKTTQDAADFLNANPEFVMKEGDAPFLLREGKATEFNMDNEEHRFALLVDSALVMINAQAVAPDTVPN